MSGPALVLVVAMAIAGCANGSPSSPEQPPQASGRGSGSSAAASVEVELRFDETIEAQDGLELRWLEIEDSRCPTGVTCIWQGRVMVTVEVRKGDGPVEVELTHTDGREPEAARAHDHELRLLGVDPYPKEGVTPEREAYVARIRVTRP